MVESARDLCPRVFPLRDERRKLIASVVNAGRRAVPHVVLGQLIPDAIESLESAFGDMERLGQGPLFDVEAEDSFHERGAIVEVRFQGTTLRWIEEFAAGSVSHLLLRSMFV